MNAVNSCDIHILWNENRSKNDVLTIKEALCLFINRLGIKLIQESSLQESVCTIANAVSWNCEFISLNESEKHNLIKDAIAAIAYNIVKNSKETVINNERLILQDESFKWEQTSEKHQIYPLENGSEPFILVQKNPDFSRTMIHGFTIKGKKIVCKFVPNSVVDQIALKSLDLPTIIPIYGHGKILLNEESRCFIVEKRMKESISDRFLRWSGVDEVNSVVLSLIECIKKIHGKNFFLSEINEENIFVKNSLVLVSRAKINRLSSTEEMNNNNDIKDIVEKILKSSSADEFLHSFWEKIIKSLPFFNIFEASKIGYPGRNLQDLQMPIIEWINTLIAAEDRANTMQKALCQMVVSLGGSQEELDLLGKMAQISSADMFFRIVSKGLAEKLLGKIPFLQKIATQEHRFFIEKIIPVIAYLIAHFGRDDYTLEDSPTSRVTSFYENKSLIYKFPWTVCKVYPICDPCSDPNHRIAFVLENILGCGAFMDVFFAYNLNSDRLVFKIPRINELGANESASLLKRTEQAFSICRQNSVMNLIYGFTKIKIDQINAFGLIEKRMDWNLTQIIEKGWAECLNFKKREDFVISLLKLLVKLHSVASHRDLKPDNILASYNKNSEIEQIELSDIDMMFTPSISCGTPGYAAPELYRDNLGTISNENSVFLQKTDVWSMGVIATLLLDGKEMNNVGARLVDLLSRMINLSFPNQYNINTIIDKVTQNEDWRNLLKSMLSIDPSKRILAKQALEWAEAIKNRNVFSKPSLS